MVFSSRDPQAHQKPCTLCTTPRDVLIRCKIDASGTWHFVCTGKCWTSVSGGVVDGDAQKFPHYRYGGMWKNKAAGVSAKKPKKKKSGSGGRDGSGGEKGMWVVGEKYCINDRVEWSGSVWVCRRSHVAREGEEPGVKIAFWKEADGLSVGDSGGVDANSAGPGESSSAT